jgi:hypothetical protein
MAHDFFWTTFDVTSLLPPEWRQDIDSIAPEAEFDDFPRTPILSREAADVTHVRRGRVYADTVQQHLPWLYKLYRNEFLEQARKVHGKDVTAAVDDRYGVVLNVQRGSTMRFECHVDSNPLTGLLFCTDHPAGGGELVVAHDEKAEGVEAVEQDGSVIRPQAGHLIFFDGHRHPHYARVLQSESDVRVVAVMNFYTESHPESERPPALNEHLFGQA